MSRFPHFLLKSLNVSAIVVDLQSSMYISIVSIDFATGILTFLDLRCCGVPYYVLTYYYHRTIRPSFHHAIIPAMHHTIIPSYHVHGWPARRVEGPYNVLLPSYLRTITPADHDNIIPKYQHTLTPPYNQAIFADLQISVHTSMH